MIDALVDSLGMTRSPAGKTDRTVERFAAETTQMRMMALLSVVLLGASVAVARDRGQFASGDPEIKAWFDKLASKRGPCCSDADGYALSDVDWQSNEGHYKVKLDGQWVDVPDEAVITVPNRVGRTMVWPIRYPGEVFIRCFMPGAMT